MTLIQKEQNFSEWYNEILKLAEILDIRYPIKGVYVWYPYGYKIRNLVYSILRSLLDKEHEEVLFPLLIPRDEFMKEKEHIKGFEDEVFWVTRGGSRELEIPFALRPTSETAMYPVFKLWIRSHRDLPLRVYQIVNTFRYETKHTRPLIRLREITSFKEAHTAHASRMDAEEQIGKAVALYKSFFDQLAIPYLVTRRPDWDKFPGAEYSLAFDTLMPDGRTLQIGTIHMLGEHFARTFDIKFEDKDGALKFVNQTCYGISERCVAAVIALHGDDHGLVLPPKVAPIQVVIVPIIYAGTNGETTGGVEEACFRVRDELTRAGIRSLVDNSEERPGAKFYRWEMKGVPLRIEIGPRDLSAGRCELVRRDDFQRVHVPLQEVVPQVERTLQEIHEALHERAWEMLRTKSYEAVSPGSGAGRLEELKGRAGNGILALFLCDRERCGTEVEEQLGISVLGEAVHEHGQHTSGPCVICSGKGKKVYAARAY